VSQILTLVASEPPLATDSTPCELLVCAARADLSSLARSGLPVPRLDQNGGRYEKSFGHGAVLLGVAAACSKQPAATEVPAPAADPKAAANCKAGGH
jgi:hypothetical protein